MRSSPSLFSPFLRPGKNDRWPCRAAHLAATSGSSGTGSRRRAVLLLGEDGAGPLVDDALCRGVGVLDGGRLAGNEAVEPGNDAVDGLAGEGRVVVTQAEEVGVEERGEERVLEAAEERVVARTGGPVSVAWTFSRCVLTGETTYVTAPRRMRAKMRISV
jgi:hypothetical protein